MTQQLRMAAPDILLLQNVFATADNRYNTAAHLARTLRMFCSFVPMRPKIRFLDGRPVESHSGLAILSLYPILNAARAELPCDPRDGQRIAQFADIDMDGVRLLVANIQVCPLAGAEAARRHQIEKLAERLSDAHDFDHLLVGGDFNAGRVEPALDPIRFLRGFTVSEAAPERGVDRIFALTRTSANLRPAVLHDVRAELDTADPATNLFPGERAALRAEITLSAAVHANVISAKSAGFPENRLDSRDFAPQMAAE